MDMATVEWKNFVQIDITFDTDHRLLTAKFKLNGMRIRVKPPATLFPPESKISNSQNDQNEYLRIIKESIEERKKEKKEKKSWISEETFKIMNKKSKRYVKMVQKK